MQLSFMSLGQRLLSVLYFLPLESLHLFFYSISIALSTSLFPSLSFSLVAIAFEFAEAFTSPGQLTLHKVPAPPLAMFPPPRCPQTFFEFKLDFISDNSKNLPLCLLLFVISCPFRDCPSYILFSFIFTPSKVARYVFNDQLTPHSPLSYLPPQALFQFQNNFISYSSQSTTRKYPSIIINVYIFSIWIYYWHNYCYIYQNNWQIL